MGNLSAFFVGWSFWPGIQKNPPKNKKYKNDPPFFIAFWANSVSFNQMQKHESIFRKKELSEG